MPHLIVMMETEEAMEKTIQHLKRSFRTIRTGRANPAQVENLSVRAYGSDMQMKQCGNISIPEARMLVIKPFDASILGDIEKAILASDLGVTPQNDGKVLRLQFPPLTEDRRKELGTQVKGQGEDAKIAVRNARRDCNKELDKLQKNKSLTEDDLKDLKEDVNELTKKFEKKIDEEVKKKIDEIMEI
ncbi:MAG: ribosome recycling factor [Planctomycetes bacterium]|nr:ribosome recycling factor [Planctomycetota bacterium]